MIVPASLDRFRATEAGHAWLDCIPMIVDMCAERWNLEIGDPFIDSWVSIALPARTSAAQQVVLKIQYPDRESRAEADALRLWAGDGAIRLVAEWREHRALLLERCVPGHHLSSAGPDVGLEILIGILPRLWVSPDETIGTLTDEVARWTATLPQQYVAAGEPFERTLVDEVVTTLIDLASSQGEQVLLHQDLHGDNVLRSQREPWLAIDPKPLVGEREFGLSPIIRSGELGHSKEHVLYRLDRLTRELGLDRERARLWAAAQAVAWGFEGNQVLPDHIEMARWLLAA